jgi:hypothetical protein
MRTISRPYGRFFAVLILGLACVTPRAVAAGGAGFGPPGAPSAGESLAKHSSSFSYQSVAGDRGPSTPLARQGELASLRMTEQLSVAGGRLPTVNALRSAWPRPHAFFDGISLTTITDTVFYANGSKAQGTVLISWPAFTTALQNVVVAGSLTVELGPGGLFNASLVPTTGSSPTGVYYTVVYQLDEGSSYFQEWSALFVVPGDAGGRICIYYPRLQACQSTSESRKDWAAPVFNTMLHASLRALPTIDANDGEAVLCYRSYFPTEYAAVY